MYTILVKYKTGNSFGSEDTEDEIGCIWKDKDSARAALKVIKDYVDTVEKYKNLRFSKEVDNFVYKLESKPWFTNKQYWEYSLYVLTDEGEKQEIHAFWNGYFERLYSMHIVTVNSIDDEDEFYC